MWSDSFTDLLSPHLLGPQHCLAGLIQFQKQPLQILTAFFFFLIQLNTISGKQYFVQYMFSPNRL